MEKFSSGYMFAECSFNGREYCFCYPPVPIAHATLPSYQGSFELILDPICQAHQNPRVLDHVVIRPVVHTNDIENKCNSLAKLYRVAWATRNPDDFMIQDGLEYITYRNGIVELDPPFLLTAPLTASV
jgi:hypothetical protein